MKTISSSDADDSALTPTADRANPKPVFRVRGVSKVYRMGEVEVHALRGVDLDLYESELAVLLGASGSGKSTIAKLISGLYPPWSGEILFDGQAPRSLPRTLFTSSVSVVDQEIAMYQGTLRDTLPLWDPTGREPERVHAATDALLHH